MKARFKVIFQIIAPIFVSTGIIATSVIFRPESNLNLPQNLSSQNKKNLLKELNYLALGDSLSSGFDWENNLDGRGDMIDGSISGISFPAFFANFAQSIQPNSVKSFKNLALNNSGISDWLYFLDPKNNFVSKENLLNFQAQSHNKSSFSRIIQSIFGDFNGNFSKLALEIKNANLISFSIGFSDFLNNFGFDFFEKLQSVSLGDNQRQIYFTQKTNEVFEKISNNLQKLISLIKKINPDAYINLIGYFSDQPKIQKFFQDLAKNYLIDLDENLLSIKRLNLEIEKVAKLAEVNFVNPFEDKSWEQSRNLFFDLQTNFRTQIKGNKQIAQKLILSLALEHKDSNLAEIAIEKARIIATEFSSENTSLQQIYLAPNDKILEKLTVKGSLKSFVEYDSNFEKESIMLMQSKVSKNDSIESSSSKILEKITEFFGSEENSFVKIIKELVAVFNRKDNPYSDVFNKIVDIIFNSRFFKNVINSVQQFLVSSQSDDLNKIKAESNLESSSQAPDLFTHLKNNALNQESFLDLYKEVASNDYVQKNPNKVVNLFFNLIFGQPAIRDLIVNSLIDKPEYKKIIFQVLSFESVHKFVTFILNELIKSQKDYSTATSFEKLLQLFLENLSNYNNSVLFIKNFIVEALKKPDFLESVFAIVSKEFGFNLEPEDQKSIITLLTGISDILTKTKTFQNLIDLIGKKIIFEIKNFVTKKEPGLTSFMDIFSNLGTEIKSFFVKKDNIYTLLKDILSFNPSIKKLSVVKGLVKKFFPFINEIQISWFIEETDPNFKDFNVVFDSFKEFLTKNSFSELEKLINIVFEDFFIKNTLKYQNSLDLNGLIFNFISNNSDFLKKLFIDFLEFNKNNESLLNSFSSIFVNKFDLASIVSVDKLTEFIKKQVISTKNTELSQFFDTIFTSFRNYTEKYNEQIIVINSKLKHARENKLTTIERDLINEQTKIKESLKLSSIVKTMATTDNFWNELKAKIS
ncbi:SGNH/GDSL hydrolase family protein [Mycoplasma sp. 'Moose RK']|uniref:SGNH/GDSL hydrolase family protein n=1 Tax=Mycoplasma sp. 'Moose RK' TaxID=2780095 RepID=UPI0018C21AE4|nr:SGNH/GDSL hydrolase family protein [Mycoplasma sp. 'Moose RK']MBG0731036.1 SGNH/GDSL hydrolase family protein [Mycoplasma sp. 'Moose RK']